MKLTALLLTAAFLNVGATGISQNITYRAKNVPLKTVFAELKKQSGFYFFCDETLLEKTAPVTINAKQEPLFTVLNKVLKPQQLNYTVKGNNIIVSEIFQVNDNPAPTISGALPPPVNGVIRDADGNLLQGVNVVIKGTKIGVTTNAEGKFSIEAKENDVLVISSIGYNAREVKITSVNVPHIIALEKSVSELDEVQYIAYGTQTKRFSVGNVTTVTAEDIEKQPVQNPMLALQGRIPGLQIVQGTGIANGDIKIQIQSYINLKSGVEPLIVIDGIPYPASLPNDIINSPISGGNIASGGSPLSFISPSDIEAISVLKDADATAIYGSRAGAGAIVITTKKGKAGKTKIDLNIQQGWGKVTRKAEMMNKRQYLDMRYEALKNDNIDLSSVSPISSAYWDLKFWDTTRDTDWQKELIGQTALYTNANASVSGGTSAVQYLLGVNYNRTTDVFPGDFADQRGSLHFSVNSVSANEKFRLRLSGSYMDDKNKLPGRDLTRQAILLEPIAPALYNPDGSLNWAQNSNGNSTWDNPLASSKYVRYDHNTKNLLANAEAHYTVFPGLNLKVAMGYSDLRTNAFYIGLREGVRPELRSVLPTTGDHSFRTQTSFIAEPQILYQASIARFKLDFLAGATFQKNSGDFLKISTYGQSSDLLAGSIEAAASRTINASSNMYRYNAFFGRLIANWNSKYIASLNWRRDGSSRFGDKNKFHNFGSLAFGWIFTEEKFIKNILPFLSFGKFRTSYGTTGHDQVGDYSYLSLYGTLPTTIPYQSISTLSVNALSNPYLQWEEVRKWQGGLDLGFLKDRIILNLTYQINRCSNQLVDYVLPEITGYPVIRKNFPATTQGTSWELMLTTNNLKNKSFSWTSSFNITIPRDKLVDFPNIEQSSYGDPSSGLKIGEPLSRINVYRYIGVDPSNGLYLVADKDGNPSTVPSVQDDKTTWIVAPLKWYGGIQNSFKFKGFELDFFLQFVRQTGQKLLSYSNGYLPPGRFSRGQSNQPVAALNRWHQEGDIAEVAKFSAGFGTVIRYVEESDEFYSYDASYLRLKNVSLSWQVSDKFISRAGLRAVSLYFQGQNLATITKYEGLDPETQSISSLPPLQMWTVGCRLGF